MSLIPWNIGMNMCFRQVGDKGKIKGTGTVEILAILVLSIV